MVKKIPERKCMGCNEKYPKRELLRVVRTPEGNVLLDTTGKQNGRGVYICKNPECFKKVRKSDKLSKNLEMSVTDALYEEISSHINCESEV